MKAVGSYMSSRVDSVAGTSDGTSQQHRHAAGDAEAISHRYDKLHPDVRPYAMMTRTCYMEYDPMKDVNLNQFQTAIERTKSEIYFTHGWSRLRDFYNIGSGAWLVLLYISPFLFNIKVRTMDGVEITYPVKSPPHKLLLDENFQTGAWDGPIPYFVLPKDYTHILEKTLTSADVTSEALTLLWSGFCQNALPHESTQLTLIDWLGNEWKECQLELQGNPPTSCRISA